MNTPKPTSSEVTTPVPRPPSPRQGTGVEVGSQLRRDWVVILILLTIIWTMFHNQGVNSRRSRELTDTVNEALLRQDTRDQSVSLLQTENKTLNDRLLGMDLRITSMEGSLGEVKTLLHERVSAKTPPPLPVESSSNEPVVIER